MVLASVRFNEKYIIYFLSMALIHTDIVTLKFFGQCIYSNKFKYSDSDENENNILICNVKIKTPT